MSAASIKDRLAAFESELVRDVHLPSERQRLVAVVRDFVEWSQKDGRFALSETETDQKIVSFRHTPSGRVAWSAYPRQNGGPKLEIFARSKDAVPESTWEAAHADLTAISREGLHDESTLRIPLSALKGPNNRTKAKEILATLSDAVAPLTGSEKSKR